MAGQFSITKIGPESDRLLRNLFEFYVHDMAPWFDIDLKADGSYSYDTSTVWARGWDAYVARVDGAIAGFALIASAEEWIGEQGVWDVREFFVVRKYRRSGLGRRIAEAIWNERPGEWLVRVLEANEPALEFWRVMVARYSGDRYREESRIVNGRSWLFLRFASR